MILTRKYAETYLNQSDKLEVIEIVKLVKKTFINLITEKEWIGNQTEAFIRKFDTITENVGYPDWIFDDNQLLAYHQNLV
jgi:predicted metalloendopeptidase